jgi:dTDP-4-amino-4,6-dideoxygalactose transaminase
MITTNSKNDYERVKSMRNQGKRFGSYNSFHTDLGNSWRMNEISAYIGCIQLAKISEMISKRQKIINLIKNTLSKKKEISFCTTSHMESCSNYKMIIKINDKKRKKILKDNFAKKNIFFGGEVYETPCHKQPVFRSIKNNYISLKNTNYYCPRHLCPPIHSGLSKKQSTYLINNMNKLFE